MSNSDSFENLLRDMIKGVGLEGVLCHLFNILNEMADKYGDDYLVKARDGIEGVIEQYRKRHHT